MAERRDTGSAALGQYLQAKRLAAGMSYRELAEVIGKAPSTIQSWEQGKRRPHLDDLLALAYVFDTDPDELLALAASPAGELKKRLAETEQQYRKMLREAARGARPETANLRSRLQELGREVTFLQNLVRGREKLEHKNREQVPQACTQLKPITAAKRIPVLGTIAAGRPRLAVEDASEYTRAMPDTQADYALVVEGDSMVGAGIDPGDVVWVRADQKGDPGDTVVALLDGREVTVKHLVVEDGQYLLRPNNPYRDYPDIPLGPEDRIIGVVERVVKRPGSPPLRHTGSRKGEI